MEKATKYVTLDIVRGMAALWVFTYHYHPINSNGFPWLDKSFSYGLMGVFVFFVVSGYCITASAYGAMRRGESAMHFLYRRFRRIFPTFWCSIIVAVSIPYVIEMISSLKTGIYQSPEVNFSYFNIWDWFSLISLLQIFRTGGQALQSAFNSVNGVYWTLAIEVQFYIAVAAMLVIRRWFFQAIVTISFVSLLSIFSPNFDRTGLFLPYWPMFGLGMGLFVLLDNGWSVQKLIFRYKRPLAGIIMFIILSIIVILYRLALKNVNNIYSNIIFSSATALLLWLLHPLDPSIRQLPYSRSAFLAIGGELLMLLGAMSYSIYLVHWKVWELAAQFARQIFNVHTTGYALTAFAVTLIICYPFYIFCEKPFVKTVVK